jgi:hypothetical protein
LETLTPEEINAYLANPLDADILACYVRQLFAKMVGRVADENSLDTLIGKLPDFQDNTIRGLPGVFVNYNVLNYEAASNTWKSVEGAVAKFDLAMPWINIKNPPIVKNFGLLKLQKGLLKENLLNEIAVGLILNEMRDYLPCFMYMYGGFFCGYPSDEEMKQGFSALCTNNSDPHACMVSEWIPNIGSFFDFVNDPLQRTEDKEKVFLLLCFAMDEAFQRYKFVHGDLHAKNILIRKFDTPQELKFKYKKQDLKITTQYVPVVIDYGASTIHWNKKILTPIFANYSEMQNTGCMQPYSADKRLCAAENLNSQGKTLGGFDIMRLLITGNGRFVDMGSDIKTLLDACFYQGDYDVVDFTPDKNFAELWTPVEWDPSKPQKPRLSASPKNERKFRESTLSRTDDSESNPRCPAGFLNELLTIPRIRAICKI